MNFVNLDAGAFGRRLVAVLGMLHNFCVYAHARLLFKIGVADGEARFIFSGVADQKRSKTDFLQSAQSLLDVVRPSASIAMATQIEDVPTFAGMTEFQTYESGDVKYFAALHGMGDGLYDRLLAGIVSYCLAWPNTEFRFEARDQLSVYVPDPIEFGNYLSLTFQGAFNRRKHQVEFKMGGEIFYVFVCQVSTK